MGSAVRRYALSLWFLSIAALGLVQFFGKAYRGGHGFHDVLGNRLGNHMGVLVHVESYPHGLLWGAIGRLPSKVSADGEV